MILDDHLKSLLKQLGTALHQSFSNSEEVQKVTNAIREEGYNLFLVMEANIALEKKRDDVPGEVFFKSPETMADKKIRIKLSKFDEKFLSAMQIKIDESDA